jgi:N-acetylneuraminic acid mutarotase
MAKFRLYGAIGLLLAALFSAAVSAQSPLGHWSLGPPLPIERSEVSVAATGDQLYVIGGYANGNVDQPLVQAFDPRTAAWKDRAPLPRGLNHIGVIGAGGKIYAFGGFQQQNRDAVADCWVYDPAIDHWSAIAPLPSKRGSVSVALLDGKIHVVGGRDQVSVATHDVYDPISNRWGSAAPLPPDEGRDHMGLLSYAGKLYAIGGRINDFNHNSDLVEVYDPTKDQWSELPHLPTARSGGAAVVYHDRLLYIGGEYGGGTFTQNEAFDPRSGSWIALASLPAGRHGSGAVILDDKLYLPAGGPVNGGSRQSNTLMIFSEP